MLGSVKTLYESKEALKFCNYMTGYGVKSAFEKLKHMQNQSVLPKSLLFRITMEFVSSFFLI